MYNVIYQSNLKGNMCTTNETKAIAPGASRHLPAEGGEDCYLRGQVRWEAFQTKKRGGLGPINAPPPPHFWDFFELGIFLKWNYHQTNLKTS